MKLLDSNIWTKIKCEDFDTVENFSEYFGNFKKKIQEYSRKEGVQN